MTDSLQAGLMALALWIILSGLDDLFVLAVYLLRNRLDKPLLPAPTPHMLEALPQLRIAIFVPLWHEAGVIGAMLEHNLAAIAYRNYDFFIGVYPNDPATRRSVAEVAARHPRVHLALCPHDGPTSKADCLNWVFQRMILAEQETNLHYEVILTHDAEDIIHPESLHLVNYYSRCYGMVQTPVLALPTPMRELVHGLYCDDFAEFHTKDMTVRQILGGFIPSSGVGTAYRRSAIEQLAAAESNRIFQPSCLTEDYENGLRLHQLGCSQAFAPILYSAGQPIATREYFPRRLRAARHQRTRWTTGIALQSWRRHGWRGNAATLYWLWRDRKGLIGNPASLLANLLLILSAAGVIAIPLPSSILAFTALLAVFHQASRVWFTGRIYGWIFALAVPVRTLLGNLINAWATFSACWNFFGAWVANRPLVWVKTEHAYPSLATLREHKRMLGEVLIATGMIEPDVLRDALAAKPANRRIGEFLVDLGRITRDELYQALGLQHGLPAGDVDPSDVPVQVARSLPLELARDLRMLAIAIEDGRIELATPDLPGDDAQERVRTHTDLEISFRLVSEENYQQLCRTLL